MTDVSLALEELSKAESALNQRLKEKGEKLDKRGLKEDEKEFSEEEKKHLKSKKAEEAQMKKALTRMMVTFAELGDLEGLKRCEASGGDLYKALDRGHTPLEAALRTNQSEIVSWLLAKDQSSIKTDRALSFSNCINHDRLDVLMELSKRHPNLMIGYYAQQIYTAAGNTKTAPKILRYIEENKKTWGVNLHNPQNGFSVNALTGAILNHESDDLKKYHLDRAKAYWNSIDLLKKEYSQCHLMREIFNADDAAGLIFLLKNMPEELMNLASISQKVVKSYGWDLTHIPQTPEALATTKINKDQKRVHDPLGVLKVPLIYEAVSKNAKECVSVLASLTAFMKPAQEAQSHPEKYFWEMAFITTTNPDKFNLYKKIGVDFKKQMPEGGNFLHAALFSRSHTKALWEKIGKELPELLDDLGGLKTTPFETIRQSQSWYRTGVDKIEVIAQKFAIKGSTQRGRQTKAVKEKARSARL